MTFAAQYLSGSKLHTLLLQEKANQLFLQSTFAFGNYVSCYKYCHKKKNVIFVKFHVVSMKMKRQMLQTKMF